MLSQIIVLFMMIFLIIKTTRNWKDGVVLYLILSMISPNLNVEGLKISFEILAFFPITLILLIKKRALFNLYKKWPYRQYLWVYILLVIVSSMLSILKYDISFPFVSIFGYSRVVIMIYMLQGLYTDSQDIYIEKIISPVLFINFVVSVIQLTIPSSVQIFYDFYYKTSLTPLAEALKLGYFNRAYGTFGTPVLFGVFSLFSFALYLGFYIEKKQCKLVGIKVIISGICGLLALSKTVILGIPILFITSYLMIIFGISKIKNKKIFLLPLVIIGIGFTTTKILIQLNVPIFYYLRFLNNPLNALTTRYSSDSGILSGTYQVIRDNLLLGVGPNQVDNAFIGDSMYVNILYVSGIIGLGVYFGNVLSALFKIMIKRETVALLCGASFILAGIAAPIHLSPISAVFISYIFTKAERNKVIYNRA